MATLVIACLIVNLFTMAVLAGFGSTLKRQPLDRAGAPARPGPCAGMRVPQRLNLLPGMPAALEAMWLLRHDSGGQTAARPRRPIRRRTPPRTRTPRA